MKTTSLFTAESNARNVLVIIFLGLAIYLKIQIILFIVNYFHNIDINTAIAGLM
jgi:cellulose synthase/poly-beta-1,6-N-acetylglucosamine synthase-like glycosyltransferase